MGKFFEASKRSGVSKDQPSSESIDKPKVKLSRKTVDTLRLDTAAAKKSIEELSFFQKGIDPRLAATLEAGCHASESFKMLRAKILTRDVDSLPRAILVTSPEPLDGKTMVSANLAISIAQGINEYVVLVDCDLRKPSLGRYLGLDTHQGGISEYLENGTSVAPYLVKTSLSKLTVLPGGKIPPNPSELLSSHKMHLLVEELKNRYEDRYLIFDATPAQFAAETAFLTSIVDAVLLVVRAGKTAKKSILQAMENIDHSKIIGVVFNASNASAIDYGHYYKHYRKGKK
jgi:capsular exopolysaccharide synthesis family protein